MNQDVVRDLVSCRRIVVKIGTNLLSDGPAIDRKFLDSIMIQMAKLKGAGYQPLIVSSGAIGLGAGELGLKERVTAIPMRQACASIGQPLLMHNYREIAAVHGLLVSQILLTREVLNNRLSYLNLQNAVETLLGLGVIPIFNENDSVSTAEIGSAFGDNDRLSAYVASKTDADLLIILTDIDGLYDKDPKSFPETARLVHSVPHIDESVLSWAGTPGSTFSTGGMLTKLYAAEIASHAGCGSVIAHGGTPDILLRILKGEEIGTYILPQTRLSQRTRWIMNSTPAGTIVVDEGALEALRNRSSLLPSGIIRVEGVFSRGSVVMINGVAKAVPSFDSHEIEDLIGCHSSSIRNRTDRSRRDVIARPEDIVFIDSL